MEHKYPGSTATIIQKEEIPLKINKNLIPKKSENRIKTRSEKSLDHNNKTIDGYDILPPLNDKSLKSSKFRSGQSIQISHSRFMPKKKSRINIDDEDLYILNFSEMS